MKIGDKVKFLDDVGGGVITRFIDPAKVMVKTEDGFEVPAMIRNLILDDNDSGQSRLRNGSDDVAEPFTGYKQDASMPEPAEENNSDQVYLAIHPTGNPYSYNLFLVNDTNYHVSFLVTEMKMTQELFKQAGGLEPNTKIHLEHFKISDPGSVIVFHVQYLSYKSGFYDGREPVSCRVEVNCSSLFHGEYLVENDFFDRRVGLFLLQDRSDDYTKSIDSDGEKQLRLKNDIAGEEKAGERVRPLH